MTPFEFLVTLISVLVGLALADVATSLHALLRARERVRWDPLPLLAALLAVLVVLEFWWTLFTEQDLGYYSRLIGFLPLAGQLLLLFLLNAAALPDTVPDEGLDLRSFYDRNGSYFWTLYALYIAFVIGTHLVERAGFAGWGMRRAVLSQAANAVVFASFILLARSRRRWLHWVVALLWMAVFLWSWWGHRLEGA
jgi:hypothetical protein